MTMTRLTTPLSSDIIGKLEAGEQVRLSGVIFTARDAAHKKLVETYRAGGKLPVDLEGQIIYYVGPCPPKPGKVIGSAGPTTSGRMDPYTPLLIRQLGLKGMIGKGNRSPEVVEAIKEKGAVYFLALGGAGALLAQRIKKAEIVAYEELGPEAIYRLEVEDFPLIVGIDSRGQNAYLMGKARYSK
ncbi:MAG TPA: Fe-S-containing hydro-lyase [Peptococcaceae bacterium]|nr:Fe-S-containing hydro-lyase [Peptococcaceae bacterium]